MSQIPLIRWLAERRGAWLLHTLEQAGALAVPGAVPQLVRHALEGDQVIAEAARRALARTYAALSAEGLLRADRCCRGQLRALQVEELDVLRPPPGQELGWTVLAALSGHANGYVRERITRWLAEEDSGHELRFLLLRANDWVPPIRRLAREAIEQRLRPGLGDVLVGALPVLRLMERWGRTDHAELLARARRLLQSPGLAAARERGLDAPTLDVRREALALALEAEPARGPELVRRAARDPERALRRWALRRLLRDNRLHTLETLTVFLLDDDLVHRQEAQRLMRLEHPEHELARFYRAALGPDGPRAALFGLGECGGHEDLELVLPYLGHPHTALRRAAVYAVGWLDTDGQADRLVQAVADPRRRVSNDAANTLVRSAHLVPPRRAQLEALARSGPTAASRANAARVLAAGEAYQRRWGG